MKKILVINLGSTSTKVCYCEDEHKIEQANLKHPIEELKPFYDLFDQLDYRKNKIEQFLESIDVKVEDLDCVITRGGHTEPVVGGIYRINEAMLKQSASRKYGQHATDMGLIIANDFSKKGPIALTADLPTTDEFEDNARFSGMPEIERASRFQALNHKAVAHNYARDINALYEDLNLIVVHMGGGISVAAHKKGKMIDGNNALDGDGPFSTNRTGGLPVGPLVEMCYSGKYTFADMKNKINGQGGLFAYTGDVDVLNIEKRSLTDPYMRKVLEAMCYQVAKDIGAQATVLSGKVDAILITGGIANSDFITSTIKDRVSFIAPVVLYPGELEMDALANYAYSALEKTAVVKDFIPKEDL